MKRSEFHAFHCDADIIDGGKNDHLSVDILLFDVLQNFNTVHPGHADIQKNKIKGLFLQFIDRIGAVLGRCDGVSFGDEKRLKDHPEVIFVVCNKDICAML